jgi:DNA sulfur modification protein DndC
MTCATSDLFNINGKNKLSNECIVERESIIAHHAKNPNAAFYFSHSAGKDSAAAYEIVKAIVPTKQLFIIHATLGAVEHKGVISYIEDNTDNELFIVRNLKKDFLDMVLLRTIFPNPKFRKCTSSLKTGPIFKFIRAHMNSNNFTIGFNISGLRAEESAMRANKSPLWVNTDLTTLARTVFDWMPAFHLTTNEVFETISKAGKLPHEAYGDYYDKESDKNQRLSCIFCIMGSLNDLILGAKNYPKHYVEMIALERVINHTMFGRTKVVYTEREMQNGDMLGECKVITSERKTSKRAIMPFKNKTFIQVPLHEKTGVPFDEVAVKKGNPSNVGNKLTNKV